MNPEQRETTRESYNRMSRIYGLLSAESEKKFVHVAIRQLMIPRPGEVVLEPGFGSGRVLAAMAGMVGDSGKTYGIDISDGMVEAAARRLRRIGLRDRVVLVRGDVSEMPWEDGFFDAVFMGFTLELFSDDEIPRILAECKRVLKGNGRLCLACMSDQGREGVMTRLYSGAHTRFPRFVDCRPIHGKGVLESSGFEVVEQRIMSMWGLPVEIDLGRTQGE